MFIIKDVAMKIKRMLDCADRYVDDAALHQPTDKDTCMVYANVAEKQLAMCMDLHALAVKKINEFKASGAEPPTANMQQLWNEEHAYLVAKHADITQKVKSLKTMM